mgnify:FL=1
MTPALHEIHARHKDALQRIAQIKNETKSLGQEKKDLETESYVKSRHLSKSFDKKDSQTLKEYGQRLKFIQTRLREIESTIKSLREEKERIGGV